MTNFSSNFELVIGVPFFKGLRNNYILGGLDNEFHIAKYYQYIYQPNIKNEKHRFAFVNIPPDRYCTVAHVHAFLKFRFLLKFDTQAFQLHIALKMADKNSLVRVLYFCYRFRFRC